MDAVVSAKPPKTDGGHKKKNNARQVYATVLALDVRRGATDTAIGTELTTCRHKYSLEGSYTMHNVKNVFEAILKYGHDEDFVPDDSDLFEPTDAPAGSDEKIEILRRRVEDGQATVSDTQTARPNEKQFHR